MTTKKRDRLAKLERLAASRCNPHEAALAAERAAELRSTLATEEPARQTPRAFETLAAARSALLDALNYYEICTMTGAAFFAGTKGYVGATTTHQHAGRRTVLEWRRVGGSWERRR